MDRDKPYTVAPRFHAAAHLPTEKPERDCSLCFIGKVEAEDAIPEGSLTRGLRKENFKTFALTMR